MDGFLVSSYWVSSDLITSSKILDWRGSDHWPIKFSSSLVALPKNPSFRFQLMWLRDSSLYDLVAKWWREGGPAYGMPMSLRRNLNISNIILRDGILLSLETFNLERGML